ncbi:energy transducer TonB [Rufibacter glacialis]|uniref:Energy transducer TonB n=1 Tax=Rufibacter glacialis TaxID=1259555 RepID=A0ABV4R9Q1_9BACT
MSAYAQDFRYFSKSFQSRQNEETRFERHYFLEENKVRVEDYADKKLKQKSTVEGTLVADEVDAYLWYIKNPLEHTLRPFFSTLKASTTVFFDDGKPAHEKYAKGTKLTFGQVWTKENVPLLVKGSGHDKVTTKDKTEEAHYVYQDSLLVSAFIYRTGPKDTLYLSYDKTAAPKAGLTAFTSKLAQTIQYPEDAIYHDREATVYIQFTVDEQGRLKDFVALNQEDFGFDKKAIEKLKAYPTWKPALLKGRPVKTRYTLPIVFRLE